ncbi:MAG: SusD/RagB family nutrient-binding outer membrane lipoprotein [Lewinellaceae bacterium]|nr:SusD/RagB family nutrient-binding outer membrane lipoprotein [Lewinella sp.]MCB9278900.1 SusD/RagB family nutrient-binding outer membrane lipoprotein [Lewinellaceae bacterium]
MNKHIYKLFALTLALFLGSCSDFGDMNIDRNNPSTPSTAALFTSAIRSMPGQVASSQPLEYVQHLTQKYYTDSSRYGASDFSYNGTYQGPLEDLQEIIKLNSDAETAEKQLINGSNENQIAIAKILQSWYFWMMTDAWGDIPYSQALQGRANFKPGFDDQSAVYDGIFATLKSAASSLDVSGTISGDILFEGDLSMWKKFANSIRMVMALRLSNVDAGKAKSEFAAAMSDGVLEEGENVTYIHLSDENNDNPWEDAFETRRDWTIAKPFMDYMKSVNDPRIPVFADKAVNTQSYEGMPYGLEQDQAGNITPNSVSFLGESIRQKTTPTYILVRAQLLFSMAEAAHLGMIGGGEAAAEDFYKAGIKASWEQWGVFDQAAYDAFIALPEIQYSAADAVKKIQYQKWVALFMNGFEAWAEWRRTGYPTLVPAPVPLNQFGTIPVRYDYPTTERDLNGSNYDAQVSKMGGDEQNVPVWWDK